MKTEFEIAKENVSDYQRVKREDLEVSPMHYLGLCSFHKATCQRISGKVTNDILFLEQCIHFEEKNIKKGERPINYTKLNIKLGEKREQLTDLKNTIKLYSENGI